MTIGTWNPKPRESERYLLDLKQLRIFTKCIEDGHLQALSHCLSPEQVEAGQELMQLHKNIWLDQLGEMPDAEMVALVRFFTLAESQLPGWEAGSKSPVIWLCRLLKKRGLFPDKELITWIKENSQNKFLPYGNPLDL